MKAFALAALAGLGVASAANANIVLDFEALEVVDNGVFSWGYNYQEDGFDLTKNPSGPEFATFGTLEGRYPGSTALFNNEVGGVTVLTAIDGSTFDLLSIDVANLNLNGPTTVNFNGFKPGGGSVSQSFTTSFNNVNVLETVNFTGFVGLERVEWSQDAPFHQFDNITIVPAPAGVALIGMAGLVARRRR
jgi:hypothetical protein